MGNQNNTMTIETINNMTREELIFETKVGSLISWANYETFNYRKAIFLILKDDVLTEEVCNEWDVEVEWLETFMYADVSENTRQLAKAIGRRIEETMEEGIVLY